jgi:autotransporter family porin
MYGGTGGRGGAGIVLSSGGTVANDGTIDGGSGGPGGRGFAVPGGNGGGGGAGIVLTKGGSVVNGGAIRGGAGGASGGNRGIAGLGGVGIVLFAGGTILNHGRITGGGGRNGQADGVYLVAGGVVTNGGTGGRAALISGGIGIKAVGTAAAKVINYRTITGTGGTAVSFGGGNDLLIVGPGAVFDGIVEGGGGRNEIVFKKIGTIALAPEYIGFSIVRLGGGSANSLAVTSADFSCLPAGTALTVYGGSGPGTANTVDASALAAPDRLIFVGGAATDRVTGGAGNDIFKFAAADLTGADTIIGGGGADTLLLTTTGTIDVAGVSGISTYQQQ